MLESPLAAITAVSLSRYVWVHLYVLDSTLFAHDYFFNYSTLSSWLLIVAKLLFSSLAKVFQDDLSQNCNKATQEH
jgi:hypothetical protein